MKEIRCARCKCVMFTPTDLARMIQKYGRGFMLDVAWFHGKCKERKQ